MSSVVPPPAGLVTSNVPLSASMRSRSPVNPGPPGSGSRRPVRRSSSTGTNNEQEMADRFTRVFLLEIDEPKMLARIDARQNSDWAASGTLARIYAASCRNCRTACVRPRLSPSTPGSPSTRWRTRYSPTRRQGWAWWRLTGLPRNSLPRGGYERLDDQLITITPGRAENPLVVKSVRLG